MRLRMSRLFPILMVLSMLLVPLSAGAAPPPPKAQYFPETGHSSVNYYWEFWKNTPNALRILGFPISEPFNQESFTEPGKIYHVQYYERAILEEHPQNFNQQGNKYYVQGRLLGTELAKTRQKEAPFVKVGNPGDLYQKGDDVERASTCGMK